MSYQEWIEQVKKILNQYDEGAILAFEAFNAIIARATQVKQIETPCFFCGEEAGTCNCP